jgi:hypothetical protein
MILESQPLSRRDALKSAAGAGISAAMSAAHAASEERVYRVGIINAARGNLHTWHFFQGFHQNVDMDAIARYQGKELVEMYRRLRNPKTVGNEPPFHDTLITHVYDPDRNAAKEFAGVFTGAQPVASVEDMIGAVDAVLLGDDTGNGDDHHDLIAPFLEAGLPTFCDKPLANTPARARAIVALAEKHKAPLLSSSLFRHFPEVQALAKLRQSGKRGPLRWLTVGYSAACIDGFIPIYGIHPVWAVTAINGVGCQAVSLIRHEGSGLITLTYKDRPPATVWMGGENRGVAYFAQGTESFPLFGVKSDKKDWEERYSVIVADLARTIRDMIRSRRQPFSSPELLEVVSVTHAALRSVRERGRLVALDEV